MSMGENIEMTLESLALLPFTRRLRMSLEALRDLVIDASADARNPQLKPYFPL